MKQTIAFRYELGALATWQSIILYVLQRGFDIKDEKWSLLRQPTNLDTNPPRHCELTKSAWQSMTIAKCKVIDIVVHPFPSLRGVRSTTWQSSGITKNGWLFQLYSKK
jgi:hypothetical protein